MFSVLPGQNDDPGQINAVFSDEVGHQLFEISGNEWVGPTAPFDLVIAGRRLTVRNSAGRIALRLRHDAPGRIVVERLDMRYRDVHVLASEQDFAVGRYADHGENLIWLHVKARIDQIIPESVAIEVKSTRARPHEYQARLSAEKPAVLLNQTGRPEHVVATDTRLTQHYNYAMCGIHWLMLGLQIAKGCAFALSAIVAGVCSLTHARRHFFARNRMNVPRMHLPPMLNRDSIVREGALARRGARSGNAGSLREPSLVLPDEKALAEWSARRASGSRARSLVASPFSDDKPGCYLAIGAFKLADSYDGPLVRVKVEKRP